MRAAVCTLLFSGILVGQQPAVTASTKLTLAEAKAYALRNNPRIHSADSSTEAAQSGVDEARAAFFPALYGLVTAVEAQHSTILAAGTLQTSSLYSRFASGIALNQLVTDFGRTSNLTHSAALRREAQANNAGAVRQQVLLQVEQAYFQALGGNAALRAAQAAVDNRNVTLRQVRALAQSSMRSTLDVSFAEVAESQAELDLYQTENVATEAQAFLAAALGLDQTQSFSLLDEPMPDPLDPNPDPYIQSALRKRPELRALQNTLDAARHFADAEGRLKWPTVSLLAAAGGVPAGDRRLPDSYSAAGVNVNIPILNGGLFSARHREAEERADAIESDVQTLSLQVAREVRVAWLEANTAAKRLAVAARLVTQANVALHLAQTRYEAGLGSIVELSQAQLNQTAAEIQNATARYDYLNRRALLSYAMGDIQ